MRPPHSDVTAQLASRRDITIHRSSHIVIGGGGWVGAARDAHAPCAPCPGRRKCATRAFFPLYTFPMQAPPDVMILRAFLPDMCSGSSTQSHANSIPRVKMSWVKIWNRLWDKAKLLDFWWGVSVMHFALRRHSLKLGVHGRVRLRLLLGNKVGTTIGKAIDKAAIMCCSSETKAIIILLLRFL